MEIKMIDKERIGAKVLFPRTQHHGIDCKDISQMPSRQDFTIEQKNDLPGLGQAKLIVQQTAPHMVFQLIEANSEEQFDDYLGKLLGMHDAPSYIEGRTDFMVLFSGSRDHVEVNQENHSEVYRNICHTQDQAARWWCLYGKC